MSSCLKRFYFYSRLKFRILDLRLYCVIIFKSVITKSMISISLLLDFFMPIMTLSEIDRKKYCETICQRSLEKPVPCFKNRLFALPSPFLIVLIIKLLCRKIRTEVFAGWREALNFEKV